MLPLVWKSLLVQMSSNFRRRRLKLSNLPKRSLRRTQILKLPQKPKKRKTKLLLSQLTVLPVLKLNLLKLPSYQKFTNHGHQLSKLLHFQQKPKVDCKI